MLQQLRQKPESYRHKVALGTATALSLFMFTGWAYSKGYFGFSSDTVITKSDTTTTQVVAVSPASTNYKDNSPIANTKDAFGAALSEISKQYAVLKDSMASVIVPFVTGIDVYNKTEVK